MFKHQIKMKIKNISLSIIALSFLAACNNNTAPEEAVEATEAEEVTTEETATTVTYVVATDGDEIEWEGYKTLNVGDNHYGTLQVTEGMLMAEGGQLTGGEFTIDMNSIHSLDLAEDPQMYKKLVGHLKSPDFFAVDSFPTAKFQITGVEEATDDSTATHHLKGNLTLRGITKNITVPANVEMSDAGISLSTPEFVIDRSQWNVRFRSTSFTEFADIAKDKVIDNNMKLKVNLKAAPQA
jgi:polyisoprenoid-binding protein YceI